MIQPIEQDFTCNIGGNWSAEFLFFSDDAETVPYSFTGWTLYLTVTHRDGSTTQATTDVASNSVAAVIPGGTTTSFVDGVDRYNLRMVNNSDPTNIEFLYVGNFRCRTL